MKNKAHELAVGHQRRQPVAGCQGGFERCPTPYERLAPRLAPRNSMVRIAERFSNDLSPVVDRFGREPPLGEALVDVDGELRSTSKRRDGFACTDIGTRDDVVDGILSKVSSEC